MLRGDVRYTKALEVIRKFRKELTAKIKDMENEKKIIEANVQHSQGVRTAHREHAPLPLAAARE